MSSPLANNVTFINGRQAFGWRG